MLTNTTVADYLTEQLNAIGEAKQFRFKIYADAANFVNSMTVQGVLVDVESSGLPVEGFTSRTYTYAISFQVIDLKLGTRTKEFNDVVTQALTTLQGKAVTLDNGQAVFTFDTPTTRGVGNEPGAGVVVYTGLRFKVLYTENATTTSNKVWLLDGMKMPYLEEAIELDKQGATNSIFGLKASQSLPIKQTKFYRFTLPFDNASPICAQLQRDMLEGDMTKTYTLSYYDGVSFTEDAPYTTTVSLFRTGRSGAKKPSVSDFTVVFTDVDDGVSGPVLYELALIDTPFDPGSENTRYFESQTEQQAWYAAKVAAGAPYSPIKAPNLNSIAITQQVYIVPAGSPFDLNSLLMKNGAVIRATNKTSGEVDYYYYSVSTANVGANNQILVDLKMDTIQTYLFNPKLKIAPCMIQRAHLNRWIDNGDGTVSFNNAPDSPMLNNEGIDLPKRLISRVPITFGIQTNGTELNEFLEKSQLNWALIYFDGNVINQSSFKNYFKGMPTLGINGVNNNLYCMVVPIGKTPIYIANEIWGGDSIFEFLRQIPEMTGYIVNMKVTPNCPFNVGDYASSYYEIRGNALYIKELIAFGLFANSVEYKASDSGGVPQLPHKAVFAFLAFQSEKPSFFDYTLPVETSFEKEVVRNSKNNYLFNPKFLSPGLRELRITDYAGNSFSYDMQKINGKKIRLLCTESLSCDITKGYIRIEDMEKSCYANGTDENYTGLVYSNDASIPFSISQIGNFLANNKNAALIQQTMRDYSREMGIYGLIQNGISGASSMISSAVHGNVSGSVTGAVGTGLNAIFGGVKIDAAYELSKQLESLTIDNMRSAPNNLKNAQGNILFSSAIDSKNFLSIYLDFYEFLEQDGEKINDNYTQFGFTYGRISDINDFINVRRYFNFLQADLQTMSGVSMSNEAREDIRRRLRAGVRFWNADDIDYSKENFENSI